MTDSSATDRGGLVERARAGDQDALSDLLDLYRNYLKLLARVHIDANVQAKADPSDLIQEAYVQVVRDFPQFRGNTEAEFLAWLRKILANTGNAMIRRYKSTQSRDVGREQQYTQQLDRSSVALENLLPSSTRTPSQIASRREAAVVLADALTGLKDDQREVLVLHHLEGLSIAEVASRMGRTAAAVKGLRTRAVIRLRYLLKEVAR